MYFGLLAVGVFPSFLLGMRTEPVKGFGVARPKAEVARHQKTSPSQGFCFRRRALGDIPEHRATRLRGGAGPTEKA